jgi:uncharacterized protein YcgI (DUF1989 family)
MKEEPVSRRRFLGASMGAVGAARWAQGQETPRPSKKISEVPIPKQSGRAVAVERDQWVKVIAPRGKQVGDFFALKREDPSEYTSPAITRSRNRRIYAEVGKPFFSNRFQPLLMLEEDTVGVHDLLYAACDDWLYRSRGETNHPNCRDNFNAALRAIDFTPGGQPDPHNLFQNSPVIDLEGHLEIRESAAKPGDYVLLRALENLVVVVTACSVDRGVLNGGEPKELLMELYS